MHDAFVCVYASWQCESVGSAPWLIFYVLQRLRLYIEACIVCMVQCSPVHACAKEKPVRLESVCHVSKEFVYCLLCGCKVMQCKVHAYNVVFLCWHRVL